jgi:hypothetical protein
MVGVLIVGIHGKGKRAGYGSHARHEAAFFMSIFVCSLQPTNV